MLGRITEQAGIRPSVAGRREDLFLAASSFEPRSVRTAELWPTGSIRNALVFRYEDTLDHELGRFHTRSLLDLLRLKSTQCDVLNCTFSEPYSILRRLLQWSQEERIVFANLSSISIDASCFTKLQLLLLLRFLAKSSPTTKVQILYTEPESYGATFQRPLSYGIQNTFYIPYTSPPVAAGNAALFLLLGHELLRAERIVDDLEPELTVLTLGHPGYSEEMAETSRRINQVLLSRTNYDHHYKLLHSNSRDFETLAARLVGLVDQLRSEGYGTFYLAPLGTKLQCLAFELLAASLPEMRSILAYSVPKRYERNYYSQGIGPSWAGSLPKLTSIAPQTLIEVAGVYYSDPFSVPYGGRHSLSRQEEERATEMVIKINLEVLRREFAAPSTLAVIMSDGKVSKVIQESLASDNEAIERIQQLSGRRAYWIDRSRFAEVQAGTG